MNREQAKGRPRGVKYRLPVPSMTPGILFMVAVHRAIGHSVGRSSALAALSYALRCTTSRGHHQSLDLALSAPLPQHSALSAAVAPPVPCA